MALFLKVAELAEGLAGEAGRLKKRAAIAAAISEVAAESLEDAGLLAMYVAGMPFAEADPRKLNAGGALLSKALLAVSRASEMALSAAYRRHGDMGAAAFQLMQGTRYEVPGTRESGLTLGEVAEVFGGMAGARTTAVRLALVEGLLRRAQALEAKYLLKLMLGDMRIGVKQSLVEEAIAVAASSEERAVSAAEVRHAVMLEADLAGAVRRAFEGSLGEARMRLFHPLGFMLASPVETPEEAVERFSGASRESNSKSKSKDNSKGEMQGSLHSDTDVRISGRDDASGGGEDASVGTAGRDGTSWGHDESDAETSRTIEAFLEDKYDGMRAQVHCGDAASPGRVAIYSRNKEEVTESFPELAEAFALVTAELVGTGSGGAGGLVFDGEILGWDLELGRALPFAVLGQRIGRKKVSSEMRRAVPVVFMAFDLMVAGGELLLELPLRERRNRLEAVVERLVEKVVSPVDVVEEVKVSKRKKGLVGQGEMFGGLEAGVGGLLPTHDDEAVMNGAPGVGGLLPTLGGETAKDGAPGLLGVGKESGPVERLMISPSRLVESAEDIDRAYADARARANEGVMLKAAGSVYQPGRRGLAWVKLKRELATLDVVVTGAEFGHGRRAGILSDYTFAVRDGLSVEAGGELLNVGKAYSGLTDAGILEMSAWMMAHTLEDQGHFRTVEPLMVLEVAFNNVMRSGRHASGFALRFPRIVRIRTDKPLSEIDTVERVEEIYQSQVDKPVE